MMIEFPNVCIDKKVTFSDHDWLPTILHTGHTIDIVAVEIWNRCHINRCLFCRSFKISHVTMCNCWFEVLKICVVHTKFWCQGKCRANPPNVSRDKLQRKVHLILTHQNHVCRYPITMIICHLIFFFHFLLDHVATKKISQYRPKLTRRHIQSVPHN